MNYSHLQNAQALHDEITKKATEIEGKVYLFFDEIQEVKDWEKCINSFRVSLDCDIYITGSNAKLLSGELATYLYKDEFFRTGSQGQTVHLVSGIQYKGRYPGRLIFR